MDALPVGALLAGLKSLLQLACVLPLCINGCGRSTSVEDASSQGVDNAGHVHKSGVAYLPVAGSPLRNHPAHDTRLRVQVPYTWVLGNARSSLWERERGVVELVVPVPAISD